MVVPGANLEPECAHPVQVLDFLPPSALATLCLGDSDGFGWVQA